MRTKIINILSNIFPNFFTKIAYDKLTNPQLQKLRANELTTLNKSEQTDFEFKDFSIRTYEWNKNKGGESILLIHGWEGQAGNFADLIEKLIEEGYTVYAFDGPSHGFSSKGRTSLFEFIELVGVMIRKFGAKKLISHSFGSVATTSALFFNLDLEVDKYALITTPDKFSERINDVSNKVGVSKKVINRLIEKLEKESGLEVASLNVSDFVKVINVKKSFIIHDKNDRVIPLYQSKNVYKNWSNCEFEEVEGTGHFRILRTEKVLNRVIEFMK